MSQDRIDRFIGYLLSLASSQDRRSLAWLRRGVGRTMADTPEAARFIYPFFSTTEADQRVTEEVYFRIATLFALHPDHAVSGNIGQHLRAAHRPENGDDPGKERRMLQLLAADREDLDDLLRQTIALLKAEQVAVNWRQLLTDLLYWGEGVKRAWARSYWRTQDGATSGPPMESASTSLGSTRQAHE